MLKSVIVKEKKKSNNSLFLFFILQPVTTDGVEVDNGANLFNEFDGDNVGEFSSIIVGKA
jgi:hypothetical protein